ncbi:MAG: tRNA (adenosine(37)-N6)-dimethylallyltransferase MiaA [Gemmataceae bacterium]|nr:tRNA (adenosine(37)-N6)-dimethylallyltransferase MiaA [Gemmataceae bacterium]
MQLPSPFTNALVLTGPTSSGKTALGVELAQALNAEIISMDSMALYRGMDIGTAKPTAADRAAVPHHLIDVLDPWESASVAWWLEQAKARCREIESRGRRVLFVGGTPLYLKAMLAGLFAGPPADPLLRRRLGDEARSLGSTALHRRLAQVDPESAARLHPHDVRRVIRALEVFELSGSPLSARQTQWRRAAEAWRQARAAPAATGDAALAERPPILWLDLPRAELYARINRRVEAMFAAGLVEEVRQLLDSQRPLSPEAAQALGYKEVIAYLKRQQSLEETIALVARRTRNFAKRQITWFRHLPLARPATLELTRTLWHTTMK